MKDWILKLKKIGYGKIGLLLAAGAALLMLSNPKQAQKNTDTVVPTVSLQTRKTEDTSDSESRFKEILESAKGIGVCLVMLSPKGDGVLVVTDGAENAEIVAEITRAAEVIFGIPAHKVMVMPYN